MKTVKIAGACLLASALTLSGCVARTYNLTRDRLDQDLSPSSGNRGYITGSAPAEPQERKSTRTTRVFEVELGFSKSEQSKYRSTTPSTMSSNTDEPVFIREEQEEVLEENFESYTVEKNDTLQKISKKFYGTTRKWPKIYEANKDILRSPDRLYTGQVLKIPVTAELKTEVVELAEPKENLK
jgi:LysM repeat protein